MVKQIFDFTLSLLGLILLSPLFLIISILIKIDDKGPVFYKSKRAGLNGKPFEMYKFRTMVTNADKIGGPSTPKDDPRITKIGCFLRKYKLDELPQLINVVKGEMSIVGPRPEVLSEVKTYNNQEKRVLSVKPGITDYASLKFNNEGEILKGSKDPHKTYREKIKPKKIKLQLSYVDNNSFITDLIIILKTIKAIIKK